MVAPFIWFMLIVFGGGMIVAICEYIGLLIDNTSGEIGETISMLAFGGVCIGPFLHVIFPHMNDVIDVQLILIIAFAIIFFIPIFTSDWPRKSLKNTVGKKYEKDCRDFVRAQQIAQEKQEMLDRRGPDWMGNPDKVDELNGSRRFH